MSPKASPLLGYNNNVRHKGHVFHIQTEDSGVRYGHVITHLFVDGGRILKSVKTSYAEHAASDKRADIVREMMKQQHKAMFIALRDGVFDSFFQGGAAGTGAPSSRPSRLATVPLTGSAAVARGSGEPAPISAPPISSLPAGPPSGEPRAPAPVPPLPSDLLRATGAAAHLALAAATGDSAPNVARPSAARALRPPSNSRVASSKPASASVDETERRFAPTRPASAFGQARPQHGKTLFGEDPLSDKSLDEVILSYLSAELDDGK